MITDKELRAKLEKRLGHRLRLPSVASEEVKELQRGRTRHLIEFIEKLKLTASDPQLAHQLLYEIKKFDLTRFRKE